MGGDAKDRMPPTAAKSSGSSSARMDTFIDDDMQTII